MEPPPQFTLNATLLQAKSLHVDPIRFASCWFEHAHKTPIDIELPWIESNLQAVCDELDIPLDSELRRRLAEQRERVIRKTLQPRRGAVKTLTRLRAAGLRTAVVGDVPPDVRILLRRTELADHLDVGLLSTSGTCKHDDPRVFRHTLYELGLPAESCLYVSSGGLDELDAADYLGMQPVAFRPAVNEDEEPPVGSATFGGYPVVGTMIEVLWLATESATVA